MAHLYRRADADSVALILQLQREDIEAAMASTNDDDNFALQLQLQELTLIESFHSDRAIAQSHALAMFADRKILANEINAEQQAIRDRELAQQLSQHDNMLVPVTGEPAPHSEADEQLIVRQEATICATIFKQLVLYTGGKTAEDEDFPRPEEPYIACVACSEDLPWFDVLETPCDHNYCGECLTTLFEASMTDESLYPPRCCRQRIPLEEAKLVLNAKLVRDFEQKSIELDTKDRTYCFDTHCSAFISADHITDNVAGCADCGKRTCAICKVAAHLGDCPRDEILQQLLQTADDQGWQRCYSCRRVVDLRLGCNHITCPCGAHFCYVCGSPWNPRTCDCPQWDENRLQERAVQIANRDPRHRLYRPPQGALDPGVAAAAAVPARAPVIPEDVDQDNLAVAIRPIQPAVAQAPAVDNTQLAVLGHLPDYQRLVDQIRDNLEANHECDHEKWRWISGPHRCEECNFQLPNYIFECRQCRIRACWRCRRNRL
ncbi:hypothetical protein D6D21_04939 [Aureobasidium pullulans]|uniref:RBR-type E3 ubiquitin transferase n=1 Tax=Aureobasidium pullulans TaxID=5580 RepID=A0AB74IYX2_AURPU|nr:hypothetical protein D6D21_04939 [Aureobasidium pullulans]